MLRWYGLEEDPFNTLSGLQLSAEVAHKWYTLRKTLKMPAQIPILCRTDGGGPARHGHVRCADAKKGLYRLVEPDRFPTKPFDNETANILRSNVSKVQPSLGGDGLNVEEYLKNLGGPSRAKLQSALARQRQGFGTPSRKKMDAQQATYICVAPSLRMVTG